MRAPTLFDRIIQGELPSHRVYEDDLVVAFLDIAPQSRGHLLVVPRESAATMAELSDESAAAIGRVLPRLCRAAAIASGSPLSNILQNNGRGAGQAVPHVHFHVIPRTGPRGKPFSGLETDWRPGSLGGAEGQRIAEHIRIALEAEAEAPAGGDA